MYVRAVERWSPGHRKAHGNVQRRKDAGALSSAQDRVSAGLAPSKRAGQSKVIHQLPEARLVGRASVMEALVDDPKRRAGRFTSSGR